MEKLHKSMTIYVKSLSKRNEDESKEKILPVGYLGQVMITHGEDFEPDSEFGNCLIAMGRTNERIAQSQEKYVANSMTGWLESLERSLAMMKEYQVCELPTKFGQSLTLLDCTQKARESSTRLRCFTFQNAEGEERGFPGRRRTSFAES